MEEREFVWLRRRRVGRIADLQSDSSRRVAGSKASELHDARPMHSAIDQIANLRYQGAAIAGVKQVRLVGRRNNPAAAI